MSAPVIQDLDGKVTLGESGAIVEYILARHANGKLSIPVSDDKYPEYLYYLHFGNGYLQVPEASFVSMQ
jgi:glutathione S-transferase